MSFDKYSDKTSEAIALIREFAKVEYWDYFKGDPEQALEAFCAMQDAAEEMGRIKAGEVAQSQQAAGELPPLPKEVATLCPDHDEADEFSAYTSSQMQEYARAALRAYGQRAVVAVPQWQPINTAPKDGSRFLAICNDMVEFFHWQHIKEFDAPVGWRNDFITVYPEGAGPTHWMPIPAAPGAAPSQPQQEAVPAEPSDTARLNFMENLPIKTAFGKAPSGTWQVFDGCGNIVEPQESLRAAIDSAIAMSAAKEPGSANQLK